MKYDVIAYCWNDALAGFTREDAQRLTAQLRDKVPGSVEVTHLVGGQTVYYYIISVE